VNPIAGRKKKEGESGDGGGGVGGGGGGGGKRRSHNHKLRKKEIGGNTERESIPLAKKKKGGVMGIVCEICLRDREKVNRRKIRGGVVKKICCSLTAWGVKKKIRRG